MSASIYETSPVLARLQTGRPLLLSAEPTSSLKAAGVALSGATATARLLREAPGAVAEHYHRDVASGVDVLCALTAETTPRALSEIGMAFRAAALTGVAVDAALEAVELASRPIAVAGVLGGPPAHRASGVFRTSSSVPPPSLGSATAAASAERIAEELAMHAARLAAAGCHLILARGTRNDESPRVARAARRAAIASAAATMVPTWAVVELDANGFSPDGEVLEDVANTSVEAGASAVLFEVDPDSATRLFARMALCRSPFGILLIDRDGDPEGWSADARRLLDAGSRILGGGAGTTHRHLSLLSGSVRGSSPSMWPRAV